MMRNVFLAIAIIGFSQTGRAQLIDNRLNVYISYSTGVFGGDKMVNEKDYISPSLYSGFSGASGLTLKALIRSGRHFSAGLEAGKLLASDWSSATHTDYEGASVDMISISPVLQIHPEFTDRGFFNRVKVFAEVAPMIGVSNLTLAKPLFEIQGQKTTVPMKSKDMFWGVKGSAGIEWAVRQGLGIYISHARQYNRVTSKFYNDQGFVTSQWNAGIIIRMKKDKYYFI